MIAFGSPEAAKVVEADRNNRWEEERIKFDTIIECVECGALLVFVAFTKRWKQVGDLYIHEGYGVFAAECCKCWSLYELYDDGIVKIK